MSNFKLNLPTDVPWKRKCVSQDMIDTTPCDQKLPYRWRSSIAVFEYEPDEENQTYEGMIITYLKVSCTITGYQEDPAGIGLKPKGIRSFWKDQPGIENYLEALQKYYACYGAILEVVVAPEDRDIPIGQYPYFLDFEPKKRELYELVTDTGETMSRSLNNIEIGKSNTSVTSHEVADLDKGWSLAGQLKITNPDKSGFEIGGSGSRQGEWGSRDMTREEASNLKNTDASQEMRETQSHTTQLSQMYHMLDSYHLGTNRALFFIMPRPHTIESERTFVNGPRNIEGIQEFMLVTLRPKEVKDLCVQAYLETGHIGKISRWVNEEVPGTRTNATWTEAFSAKPKGDDDETPNVDDKDRVWNVADFYPGYKIIDAWISGMKADIRYNYSKPNLVDVWPHISELNADFIRVSGKVHSGFKNHVAGSDRWEEINLPFTVDITLAKMETVEKSTDTLFITGRGLCCCAHSPFLREGIVYERTLDQSVFERYKEMAFDGKVPARMANIMGSEIRSALIRSRNDYENRYHGLSLSLVQTDFMSRSLRSLVPGDHIQVRELGNLDERIKEKILNFGEDIPVSSILDMPFQMQRDVFDLSSEEVLELRNSVSGINYKGYDPRTVWLTKKQRERYLNRNKGHSSS